MPQSERQILSVFSLADDAPGAHVLVDDADVLDFVARLVHWLRPGTRVVIGSARDVWTYTVPRRSSVYVANSARR